GFDMQASPVAIENARAFLTLADPGYLPQAETVFAKVAAADARSQATPADIAAAQGLFAYMSGRRADYLAAGFPEADVDWAIQNARILVQLVESLVSIPSRDKSMADNAAWILDHAPAGSKIVLWAHNGHVRKRPGFMGGYLDQRYGRDQYVLGFAYEEGSYNAVGPFGLTSHATIPPPPDTLETFLGAAGIPRYILDLRGMGEDAPGSWLKRSHRMKAIGALAVRCEGFVPTTAADEYDGLIWIESTSPSVRLPFD
ncbi:MAG TPA: erythromycin esterase family protein, partial [Thermoanaerobaculia bacterium]